MDKAKEVHPATLALAQQMMAQPTHSTVQTVNQNANGAVLLVAALMLGLNLGLAIMVMSHDRKIERLQDYLQVVYTHAPHLKSIAEAEIEKESNR